MSEVEEKLNTHIDKFETQLLDSLDIYRKRISSLEVQVKDCERSVRQRDETVISESKKECQQLKQVLEESMQDLGRAVMECLKRRDATSTPVKLQSVSTRSLKR